MVWNISPHFNICHAILQYLRLIETLNESFAETTDSKISFKDWPGGAWIRICVPVPGTQFWSLVWEDFTFYGATNHAAPQLLALSSRTGEATAARNPHAEQGRGVSRWPATRVTPCRAIKPRAAKNKIYTNVKMYLSRKKTFLHKQILRVDL